MRLLPISNVDKPANCRGPEVSGVQSRLRWGQDDLNAGGLREYNHRAAERTEDERTETTIISGLIVCVFYEFDG